MRVFASIILGLFAMLSVATSTSADIAPPRSANEPRAVPPYDQDVARFVIESSDEVRNPQLHIPSRLMAQSGAGPSHPAGGLTQGRTVAAGTALSLAAVFAGIWLLRSRRRLGARVAAAATLAGLFTSAALFAFGNAAPPHARTLDAGTLAQALETSRELAGYVEIHVDDESPDIRLVLPARQPARKD